MAQSEVLRPATERPTLIEVPVRNEQYSHGVSWAAVIGGAFVSASLALILLSLGTGLGFSAISPWSNTGASASTVGKSAIIWLIVTQIVASAMGGYLAGRLRTKWVHVHTDEVYFRDTAHGFLVWAVGLVITVAFLASAATSLAGRTELTRTSVLAESTPTANAYFVDTLIRSNGSAPQTNDASERGEVDRIFVHALAQGSMPAADNAYLTQLVSARAGLSPSEAQTRVSDVFVEAQQSADRARKAVAYLSLWLFVALLSGAFSASYAGTIGGKQRDHVTI